MNNFDTYDLITGAATAPLPTDPNRLVVVGKDTTPDNVALTFASIADVQNYYGVGSPEAVIAKGFFSGAPAGATLSFIREGLGQRPHLLGANIAADSLATLRGISGTVSLTFDGFNYVGSVDLSGVSSANPFADAALQVQAALNRNLQPAATTTGSSITAETTSFMGYFIYAQLYVTSVQSGKVEVGGHVFGNGVQTNVGSNQIIFQHSGIPGGAGSYSCFSIIGRHATPEPMTETYGILTLGSVTKGAVAVGDEVTGPGVPPLTAIIANLTGTTGPGSKWLVSNAVNVTGPLTMTAPPLTVQNNSLAGATQNNDFFEIQPNGAFGFNTNPSDLSSMRPSTAADALGLTQAAGAIDSSPGGQHPTIAQFMNNVVAHDTNQFGQPVTFGSLQNTAPQVDTGLAAWAQAQGVQFIGI